MKEYLNKGGFLKRQISPPGRKVKRIDIDALRLCVNVRSATFKRPIKEMQLPDLQLLVI